jgi:hypothetical protein
MISLDHCTSCRRIAGALVESWFICPQSWIAFTLQPRSLESPTPKVDNKSAEDPEDVIKPATISFLKPDKKLTERTYLSYFASSEHSNRTFCGKCGTHLTFYYSAKAANWGPFFDVAVGTLDRESLEMEGFGPSRQAWMSDGIGWVQRLLKDGEKSLTS